MLDFLTYNPKKPTFIHVRDKEEYKKMLPLLNQRWKGWKLQAWSSNYDREGGRYITFHDSWMAIDYQTDQEIIPASEFLGPMETDYLIFN